MEWEDEETWLRHRVMRMRTILRFANSARVEAGLRELIAEAEQRLVLLQERRQGIGAPPGAKTGRDDAP
jgi:hypothetical protein